MAKLTWGIMGLGRIAGIFAKGLLTSRHGRLAAVASRTAEKAARFGADFLPDPTAVRRHDSYAALLADPEIQAVYIATPHPQHPTWAIRALEAGKAVLVEKPLGLNYADAVTVINTARDRNVFLMEAFMYRCHPIFAKASELIRAGAIGPVRALQANFAFNCGPDPSTRLLANSLGGGGILDVGCYPVSLARLLAGVINGQDAPVEPAEVKAVGHVGGTGVDEYTYAVLKFPGDFIATIGTGTQCGMDNTIRIYGAGGSLELYRWVPLDTGNKLVLRQAGQEAREFIVDADCNVYGLEADVVAEAMAEGRTEARFPAMSWADTLGNMKTLDQWRAQIGQKYEVEKPATLVTPRDHRPLRVRPDAFMNYGQLLGVKQPVSRLVLGTMTLSTAAMPYSCALLDDYFERGGNAFDTAFVYGGGDCERTLGHWIRHRQIRPQVIILGKGAMPPFCTPAGITEQLETTLDRLQTDYLDLYMLHRDNPDVPIGEFVDVLNQHLRAGRLRAFGGSNWTSQRVDAFNAYARSHGLQPMSGISNQFSLARMVTPIWAGCLASSEPAFRAWHTQTQFPLLPWSSQARGFFTLGDPAYTANEELNRCWYADDNFARLARAKELGRRKNASPLQIALAYVLHQPFPTFPLIGPRTLEETQSSLAALQIQLTPEEIRWLNLEDGTGSRT